MAGSLHARDLTLDPWPQEAVHWDHSPHGRHSCGSTTKENLGRMFFFTLFDLTKLLVLYQKTSDRPSLCFIPWTRSVNPDGAKLLWFSVLFRPNFFSSNGHREGESGTFLGLTYLERCPLSNSWLVGSEFLPHICFTIQSCDDVDSNPWMEPDGGSPVSDRPRLAAYA